MIHTQWFEAIFLLGGLVLLFYSAGCGDSAPPQSQTVNVDPKILMLDQVDRIKAENPDFLVGYSIVSDTSITRARTLAYSGANADLARMIRVEIRAVLEIVQTSSRDRAGERASSFGWNVDSISSSVIIPPGSEPMVLGEWRDQLGNHFCAMILKCLLSDIVQREFPLLNTLTRSEVLEELKKRPLLLDEQ